MDYARFRSYRIAPVPQAYGPAEALLYAHSVQAGAFLGHPAALDYLSDTRGPAVLPTFAVDLGHPGFWLADPATTVDAAQCLHAEESVRLFGPLPPAGNVLGTTRITDVVDKGRAALVYLEKEVTDPSTGRLLALCRRVLMLRGDGGYDGPSGPVRPAPALPETPPDHVCQVPTRPEQALLYRLNGDTNPLHLEPAAARQAGFDRPILQGLCTFGIAATAALFGLAGGAARRFGGISARFSAPVFPGETLRIEMWNSGALRAIAQERDVPVLTHGHVELLD